MNGKQKCEVLKNIRRTVAKANKIPLDISECTHKGDCPGTCPRCESEVKQLEAALEKKRKLGKKVAITGISAGLIAATVTSCDTLSELKSFVNGNELQGDMMVESVEGLMPAPETENTELIIEGDIPGDFIIEPDTTNEDSGTEGDN